MMFRDRALRVAVVVWTLALGGVAGAQCEERQKVVASDGAPADYFGWSVAASDGIAVVGAYSDAQARGAAYVYRFDGTAWREEQKLVASDGETGDRFGLSVAISGNVIIVGAYGDSDGGAAAGSAYLYRYNGLTWHQERKLIASDGGEGRYFGFDVSISGPVAIVAAPRDHPWGSVYVYRRDGGSWREEQKLLAPDGESLDEFGTSVSVSGDRVIVGAPADEIDRGSVHVFRFHGSTWHWEAKIVAPAEAIGDRFGESVSISGRAAVIGAPGHGETGTAYVTRHNGGQWAMETVLRPPDGQNRDAFGSSVAIDGSVAVVGASHDDDSGDRTGSAYVFRHNGWLWTRHGKMLASDAAAGATLGRSLAIAGDHLVVGAPLAETHGQSRGSLYWMDTDECRCRADLDGNGEVDFGDIQAVLAAWGYCPGCTEDFDANGHVQIRELMAVLRDWGPCP